MSSCIRYMLFLCLVLLLNLFIGCNYGEEVDPIGFDIYPSDKIASNSGVFLMSESPEMFRLTIGGVSGETIFQEPSRESPIWKPNQDIPKGMQRIVLEYKVNGKFKIWDIKSLPLSGWPPETIEVIERDTILPSRVSSNPENGGVISNITSDIKLTFSELVVFVDAEFYLNDEETDQYNLNRPGPPYQVGIRNLVLQPDTEYTLTIKGIRDLAWNEAEEIRITFKTP